MHKSSVPDQVEEAIEVLASPDAMLTPSAYMYPLFVPETLKSVIQHVPNKHTVLLILAHLLNDKPLRLNALDCDNSGMVLQRINVNENQTDIIAFLQHPEWSNEVIALKDLLYPKDKGPQLTTYARTVLSDVLIVFLHACRQLPQFPLVQHALLRSSIFTFTMVGHSLSDVMRTWNTHCGYVAYPDNSSVVVFVEYTESNSIERVSINDSIGLGFFKVPVKKSADFPTPDLTKGPFTSGDPFVTCESTMRTEELVLKLYAQCVDNFCDQKVITSNQAYRVRRDIELTSDICQTVTSHIRERLRIALDYKMIAITIVNKLAGRMRTWHIDHAALKEVSQKWIMSF